MQKNHVRPALSAFLLMLTMSLLSTALSFFVTPVCEDLGFGRGSFTLYYSLMVASGAVSASFLGGFMAKRGVAPVVTVSALWCGAGLLGFSFSSQLWMFYAIGAAMGFFGSTCAYLAANVIVQQSYSSKDASAMLGIVMAGAGIGGVIWSNVVPKVIASFGWRFGYRMLGICWVMLALLAVVILGRQSGGNDMGHARSISDTGSKKQAMKSFRFFLAVWLMCVLTVASCISQQLPALLEGLGHSASKVGVMISVMTAFSAIGTVAEGLICSKAGIRSTMIGILVVYVAGYAMLSVDALVYVALMCLAVGSGSIGTLMPIVVRTAFGGRDYAAIWSVVITCSSVASFLATPVWGMVYDIFGSYTPALILVPVLLISAVPATLGVLKK